MTDVNQNVVWQASYTPFGQATVTTETVVNNIRFPGQYFDAETGLHYNYFRDYDPEIGRYIQSDPIGLNGGINTYGYVHQNPINGIDPDGRLAWFGIPIYYWITGGALTGATIWAWNHGVEGTQKALSSSSNDEDCGCQQSGGIDPQIAGMYGSPSDPNGNGGDDWLPPEIRGTQVGLRDPNRVGQIRNDMTSGNYRYTSPEGQIGGFRSADGAYHVAEGHHRMAAAREIFRQTGNSDPIRQLIRNGRWTHVRNSPTNSRPLPGRGFWDRCRNYLGF